MQAWRLLISNENNPDEIMLITWTKGWADPDEGTAITNIELKNPEEHADYMD
jgi:hypothetical protein